MNENMTIHRKQVQAILHSLDQLIDEVGQNARHMPLPSIQRTGLAMKAITSVIDDVLDQNQIPQLES